jgi:Mn-dependent DtxR family transcriptional regulator
VLGIDGKDVHAEAHKLEHAFSDSVIKRLAKFLGNPKTDPHGKKIKKV